MAAEGSLTGYPVPANAVNGSVPGTIYHVLITTLTTFTAGTWLIPHTLEYTPTFAIVIPRLTENTAPAATNALVGWCEADTTSTNLAVNLLTGTSMTYDVLFG